MTNILDIGSRNVNGTLRDVKPPAAAYLGVDLTPGPGVELVLQDPHRLPFDDDSFDVVVSTSCLEHDPLFWLTFGEMLRVVRPGGFVYINAPSNGVYHGYPFDHWRFYPDAGRALEAWSRRLSRPAILIESFIGRKVGDVWADNVMVFSLEPLPSVLPEPLLHARVPGSSNVRVHGCADLLAVDLFPEDLRELRAATDALSQLRAQLQQRDEQLAELTEALQTLRKRCAESTPSASEGA